MPQIGENGVKKSVFVAKLFLFGQWTRSKKTFGRIDFSKVWSLQKGTMH